MFYSAELLTRRGVYALAWLAGTTENVNMLRGYLDRMIKAHGRANILKICDQEVSNEDLIEFPLFDRFDLCFGSASILQPAVPLSLRLRAILMLGIVRLFSEQVKETEKEAHMCMRRIMHRTTQAKPVGTSLIDTLVEPGMEDQDMLDMWKKNRRLLHMIDCATGTAPTLSLTLPDASSSGLGHELNSTIWRDYSEYDPIVPDPDFLRGEPLEPDSSLISLPHLGAPLSWPIDRSFWPNHSDGASDPGVDPMRGDLTYPEPVLPQPHFDLPLDDIEPDSSHFLDRLVEDHDGFQSTHDDLMRSVLNESISENIQEKLEDLLAPPITGIGIADEPLLHSLYDNYVDRDDGPTYDYGNEVQQIDEDVGMEKSAVGSFASDTLNINGSMLSKSRRRTYIVDEEPKISHIILKATIEKFSHLPPRSDREVLKDPLLLESRVLNAKLVEKNFLDVETIMKLPRGESFQISGALAYARLVCMTRLTNGMNTGSQAESLREESVMNLNESRLDANSVFGAYLAPNSSAMDIIQVPGEKMGGQQLWMDSSHLNTSQRHDDQDEIRGLWDQIEPFNQAVPTNVQPGDDEEDLIVRFGPGAPKPTFGQGQSEANIISSPHSASQLLVHSQTSSIGGLHHTRDSERSAFHSDGFEQHAVRQPPSEGLSRALLSYLTVKAARPMISDSYHSADRNSAASSNASTSTSAEARKMGASLVDGSLSQGGAPFSVSSLLKGSKRRTAAKTFLHLLELANSSHIFLIQEEPFADIAITVIQ